MKKIIELLNDELKAAFSACGYDEKYAKSRYDDLPILPEHWQYQVSASTKKQFGILQKLMHRPDVDSIVNSCDAG